MSSLVAAEIDLNEGAGLTQIKLEGAGALPRPRLGHTIRFMKLCRSSRSAIALLTALLFLLCQTAVAAQARLDAVAGDRNGLHDAAPCHESTGSAEAPLAPVAISSCCDAPAAVTGDFKPAVVALSDLPVLTVAVQDIPLAPPLLIGPDTRAVCYSPPSLNLLHCRFLI